MLKKSYYNDDARLIAVRSAVEFNGYCHLAAMKNHFIVLLVPLLRQELVCLQEKIIIRA